MLRLVRLYAPRGLRLARAEGQYVWSSDGRRFLDLHNAYGVAFLGHRNPVVMRRLREQMDRMMVASPIFDTDVMEEAVKMLSKVIPRRLGYFFMLNGGSEAVEMALKVAKKTTGREKFISFINGFHGRSMGALSVTWNPKYRSGFGPFPWKVEFIPYNNLEAVEKAVDEDTAGVILEPVQGEGGLTPATPEFLKAVREACDKTGALMIVDEVQSGFGRTGRLWAHEVGGVEPDIMTVGKSIGGGFPVSVVAFREDVGGRIKEGDHGSTFGANPMALAAVSGGVEALTNDNVVEKAAERGGKLGKILREIVEEHPRMARAVKGVGLMTGIELRFNPTPALKLLQQEGIIALKAGLTVLRFLPPYLISDEDLSHLRESLNKVFSKLAGSG